jgi:hypothetical protein
MNKWVNPPPRMKTEDEFPPQDAVTHIPPTSFDTIKKQVGKKKLSKKSKKERVSAKSISLAENLGMRKD